MKKHLLLLAVALIPLAALAQSDTTRTNLPQEYCAISPITKAFTNKITVNIDYGQEYSDPKQPLTDANNRPIIFNSMVTAINYMARQGWLYVDKYSDNTGLHYLLRRKDSIITNHNN